MKNKAKFAAVMVAVLAGVILFSQPVFAYIEGNTIVTEDAKIKAGITPGSVFYGLDKALDRVSLALTFGSSARAKTGLTIARERLMEVKVMVEANDTVAAGEAQRGHARALASVSASLDKLKGSELNTKREDVISLEKGMLEHESEIIAVNKWSKSDADAGQITFMLDAMQNSMADVRIQLFERKREIALEQIAAGKIQSETETEIIVREEGLIDLRKQSAAEEMKAAHGLVAYVKGDIDARLKAARSAGQVPREDVSAAAAAAQILLQADLKLGAASEAFADSEFEQAFELAHNARRLGETAQSLFAEELEAEAAVGAEAKADNAGAGVSAKAGESLSVSVGAGVDVSVNE
ncbi:hypothetical protein HYX10_04620 [Candidatus Woesearchaeota archaeon]|nr:hypothetical protein [Candidatus Woesearchaeota archaeon]